MPIGEFINVTFFLRGAIPSKANRKRVAMRGRYGAYLAKPSYYTPSDVKAQLQSLEWQARTFWGCRHPLTEISIDLTFHVSDLRGDDDNSEKGLFDLLKHAGVIQNDSRKHILNRKVDWTRCAPGMEGVQITVRGYEYIAPKKRRAA